MPIGELEDGSVVVHAEKDANTLYNKGAYGTPRSGGALEMDLAEAAYLVEQGRLTVEAKGGRRASPGDLLALAARDDPAFLTRYVVYRDLRQRTLVVKASGVADFNVYPPGSLPGKAPSRALVRAVSERGSFRAEEALADARRAVDLKKRFIVAVVDEEGDLTYYEVKETEPKGDAAPDPARFEGSAVLAEDRALVLDDAFAARVHKEGFYGRPAGAALHMGLAEALHLAEAGGLAVRDLADGELSAEEVRSRARAVQPDFDLRYRVYRDLRSRGLAVKTGLKFGTHFRAYRGSPEAGHAPYLVHALDPARPPGWPEVAGFVRVAHGVRKIMLFATPRAYVELKWTKP